jgi:hypothetical protein
MYAGGKFRTKGIVTYRDTSFRYFVKVDDFHLAGDLGPFEYQKKVLKKLLLINGKWNYWIKPIKTFIPKD